MESAPIQQSGSLLSAKLLFPIVGVILLVSGIAAIVALNKTSLDTRQKASTSAGTVTVTLKPGSSQLAPNSAQTLELQTNTALERVIGYELYIDFTGTVPSNLTYTPAQVTDLSTAVSDLQTTSTGKRLTLGLLTPVATPPKSFGTSNGTVTLGRLTFTSPASGSFTVSIVPQQSRALRFSTTNTADVDVLKTPTNYTYTFGVTATPRPTTAPVPTGFLPGGTTTPIIKVCYNTVIKQANGTLVWPNGCRGVPTSGACTQVITPLTSTEIKAYQTWVASGSPAITGCTTVTPTTLPKPSSSPTPPPGCVYKQVQCVQAPCNPILVCSTPTPKPVSTPVVSIAPTPRPSATPSIGQTPISDTTCARVICQNVAGCTCPSYCNFPTVPNTWTCGGLKATPQPTSTPQPTAVAVPFDGVITQEQWNRLPAWIKTLVRSVLGI